MTDPRVATPEDADELMRLRAVMLSGLNGTPPAPGDWSRTGADLLRTWLAAPDPEVVAFVVDKDDAPGLASCVVGQIEQRLPGPNNPSGRRGYVFSVATDPAYRRRGFSRACMTALVDWFTRRGIATVDLRASAVAEPLYASLGFVRTKDPAMRLTTGR